MVSARVFDFDSLIVTTEGLGEDELQLLLIVMNEKNLSSPPASTNGDYEDAMKVWGSVRR